MAPLDSLGELPYGEGMDLGLDIDLRTRGRAARPITAVTVRELVPADYLLLQEERGIKAPSVQHIRESHHRLAMAVAQGMRPAEVAHATGYSLSRVSILCRDPAIMDLIETYRTEVRRESVAIAAEIVTTQNAIHLDGLKIIHERMVEREGTDSELSVTEILKLTEMVADRSGYAPQKGGNTQVTVNVATPEKIAQARARAGLLIEATAVEEPGA